MQILDEELGVAPSPETNLLYEQIQTNTLTPVEVQPALFSAVDVPPAKFRVPDVARRVREPEVFVGRERQMAYLDTHLAAACAGQGRVVFITGEAGQGKTALLTAFAQRAQKQHPDLIVAAGACTAHFGAGDPFLPFCDIFNMLTGGVEHSRVAGQMTREHVRRLRMGAPYAIEAILDVGADLIDVMVSGSALIQRASAIAPNENSWTKRVRENAAESKRRSNESKQRQIFEQYVRVLHAMAKSGLPAVDSRNQPADGSGGTDGIVPTS